MKNLNITSKCNESISHFENAENNAKHAKKILKALQSSIEYLQVLTGKF